LNNAWKKTNEQELFNNLKIDYGISQALAISLVQLMHEHIETSYGNLRGDSQVVYHAVSVQEGPGKSLDHLRLVPVTLTISHPDDAKVLKDRAFQAYANTSSSDLRMKHMIRAVFSSRKISHCSLQPASIQFKEICMRCDSRVSWFRLVARSRISDRPSPIKRRSLSFIYSNTAMLASGCAAV
jgi:hypothetical protein